MIRFHQPPGSTPIDPGAVDNLVTPIQTQRQLDELETDNISRAASWLRRARVSEPFSSTFLHELHRQMFNQTWKWAGQYRKTETTIGCDPGYIAIRTEELLESARYWVDKKSYTPEEICIRLHHDLVEIHLFENGNGRHARMYADFLAEKHFGLAPFTWGSNLSLSTDQLRARYVQALQGADAGRGNRNYGPLLEFARS
ncbi:MAG: mobile mystery protein B [Gammaproteobacteria bacterium]